MRFCIYFLQRVLLYFLEMAGQFNQSANIATTATKKDCFGFAKLREPLITKLDIPPNEVQLSETQFSVWQK